MRFEKDRLPELVAIQKKFFEKTGLLLSATNEPPTEETIKNHEAFIASMKELRSEYHRTLYECRGTFTSRELGEIAYWVYQDKIEIHFEFDLT
ncbi:hypothetical protein SAMN05421823_102149 [Catalinimonas alkaloidigena]|uniref:Uncharacterized protein n=2 Tax=Catalinimonas alkaloidigena TaxID=1075417 RepID=A0A1G9A0V2_9BACT|nr:hypothetical protein SAMN05421823_102149 [Catalinimonas alkaloidigena]